MFRLDRTLSRTTLALICGVFLILILSGAKSFTVSHQMEEVYRYSENWSFKLTNSFDDPLDAELIPENSQELDISLGRILWFPRKLIIFPTVFVHHVTGVNIHRIYSLEIFILLIATSFLLAKVASIYSAGALRKSISPLFAAHASVLFFFTLSLAMNGRMVFAFFAVTLLMYTHAKFIVEKPRNPLLLYPMLFFVFLCAGSSSGVYSVVYTSAFILILGNFPKPFLNSKHRFGILGMFVAAAAWFLLGLYKNLLYYGGEVTRVFTHGFGAKLPQLGAWSPAILWGTLIGSIALSCWALYKLNRSVGSLQNIIRNPFTALGVLSLVGFVGGFFGYSTLTTAIPPLVVAGLLLIAKIDGRLNRRSEQAPANIN